MPRRSPSRTDYRAGAGHRRFLSGTPPILSLAALEAALDVRRRRDRAMSRQGAAPDRRFIAAGRGSAAARRPLASPRDAEERGSQVCFAHPEGYEVMQALIARGVIGDFRAPD